MNFGESQFCKNCNFEFLVGKYVKLDDENSSQDEIITTEKVSQEEFVESNEMLRQTKKKINCCIAKYLNYELTNQYNAHLMTFLKKSILKNLKI